MNIRVLHIDDDMQVLQDVKQILNGMQIGDDTIIMKDGCDFNEGIEKLKSDIFDLVLLDLCIGDANEASDKVGAEIFEKIKALAFVPIIFFTALPGYVHNLESDIVRVAGKAEGYDELIKQMKSILSTGFVKMKSDIDLIVKEGVRGYFWDFVHPNQPIVEQIKNDDVSLKYLLLRRLSKSLSSEVIRNNVEDPLLDKDKAHPMEFYIYPPVDGEFETGDIIKEKESGNFFVILTPACDLIERANGKRKAEKVLVVQAMDMLTLSACVKYKEAQTEREKFLQHQQTLPEKKRPELNGAIEKLEKQIVNLALDVKKLMKPGNDRFFFLPKTPFLPGLLIDFQIKKTIIYENLESDYDVIATLDDPHSQSMQSSFIRYYNRVGFPDLDIDYVFENLMA
ncbi:MAG: response regulator [Bacteroidia bacterium]